LSQNFHTQNTTMAMNATPPITPPTMAPMLGPLSFELVLDSEPDVAALTQVAFEQVLQPSPNCCEHTSSDLQDGHVGAVSGHVVQRLKRELAGEKSWAG
jgi:hypothetical protein